ncbi:MAG TPA: hypothetical protein VF025_10250 [Gaiellaceae bacterium]
MGSFRWPLDPALAEGRDETTLARTLYSTPLRTDPATGAVVPGLCTAWHASAGFRRWAFTCASAPSIAAALRRVAGLSAAPARWLFASAARITAPSASSLVVQLREPWRRFPYALTAVAAAPRSLPGPFRLVSGSARRVVVRREGLTVVFRRLDSHTAAREFRRGRLDEAPVPTGDIVATARDTTLGKALRVRTLLGLDLLTFRGGPAQDLRGVYGATANRTDYEQLVPEIKGAAAFDLTGRLKRQKPATFRDALKRIPSLPRVRVAIGVPHDPVLRYGAQLLYASWRDVGLGPVLVDAGPGVTTEFGRLFAAYPQAEALFGPIVAAGLGSRQRFGAALAATEQAGPLARLDEQIQSLDRVVPVAWARDARLVSPRLTGWREDLLGNVDYGTVTARASGAGG